MSQKASARTIVLAGSFDTKGHEFEFVRHLIEESGLEALAVDFGVLKDPPFAVQISSREVAAAGNGELDRLRANKDKAEAMRVMQSGLAQVVRRLYDEGRMHGILGMGGTGGTTIAAAAMRGLPVGVPKALVSTVGSSDMSAYVGSRDIVVFPSIVDVAGVNRISRLIYSNAAAALIGMVSARPARVAEDRPLIAASMFGNSTPCVDRARAQFEKRGYEVLVFHATGAGGKTMKSLIEDGYMNGVFDITTTELADEVCGGVFSAGADRVRIAASRSVPVVFAPGCVDMCNFWARDTVPEKHRGRNLYEWNPSVTLLRTNVEENSRIGAMLAETANSCLGPAVVLIPLRGVSMLDSAGNPFWDPQADAACFAAIRQNLKAGIPLIEVDANINDPNFADQAAEELLSLMAEQKNED